MEHAQHQNGAAIVAILKGVRSTEHLEDDLAVLFAIPMGRPNFGCRLRTSADGHVRSTAQLSAGAPGTARWAQDFARALRTASADPRYATLAGVAARGAFEKTASAPDAPFEFGLHRLLDGIEAFVRARPRRTKLA